MMHEPPAIYGIIGNPLKHSLSPAMHNAAFKALEANAVYKMFPLADEGELRLFMEDLKEANSPIFGLNVTVPYKEKVLPFLNSLDPFAAKVGAVNTIVIDRNRQMRGFNTDGPGFLSHLAELGFAPKAKRVAVLGAGGTARAVIMALSVIQERPERIVVYNRTGAHAAQLAADIARGMDAAIVDVADDIEDLHIESADLLINTTSVGMKASDPLLINPDLLHQGMLAYDVIYSPSQTALLAQARRHGAQVSNGLGMLFYQGVLAFQHWGEMELDEQVKKVMRKSLEGGLNG